MMDKTRPYHVTEHMVTNIGRFHVVCDTIEINDCKYPYSYLSGGSYVVLLPLYRGQVVYIHQYRHALNEWLDELPGGSINKGETPEKAAERELLEETGLSGEMVKLCEFPGSQGTSAEMCYIYVAFCNKKSAPQVEPTELIEIREAAENEFGRMVEQGKIRHLTAIVAWYYYQLRKGVDV